MVLFSYKDGEEIQSLLSNVREEEKHLKISRRKMQSKKTKKLRNQHRQIISESFRGVVIKRCVLDTM